MSRPPFVKVLTVLCTADVVLTVCLGSPPCVCPQIEEIDNEGRLRHLDVYGKLDVEGLEDLLECVC